MYQNVPLAWFVLLPAHSSNNLLTKGPLEEGLELRPPDAGCSKTSWSKRLTLTFCQISLNPIRAAIVTSQFTWASPSPSPWSPSNVQPDAYQGRIQPETSRNHDMPVAWNPWRPTGVHPNHIWFNHGLGFRVICIQQPKLSLNHRNPRQDLHPAELSWCPVSGRRPLHLSLSQSSITNAEVSLWLTIMTASWVKRPGIWSCYCHSALN